MRKTLALLLSLLMVIGLVGSAMAADSKYYGGYDDMIESTIVVYQRGNQGDAANIWWWDFCREYFGIDFKVTQVTSASDHKSVAFASGDMSDVFYQMFISSSQAVEQGEVNGNLIALDPYITPEIMPNLSRIYDKHPEYKTLITGGDGHIYSLGSFNDANQPQMTFYINQRWLDEAGLPMATTLDDFTKVMAAFKERKPANEGDIIVPLTGDLGNQPRYLANAFGWTTHAAGYLTAIALKDDVPLFIYADEERFPEFMQLMKDYIAAGYFSSDVFSDQYAGEQTKAQKANDLTGFDQNTSNAINPDEWTAAIPLTSKWKDTPSILRSINAVNCQSFSISSSCAPEKVERLMKWVDWLYDYDNYLMAHWGPSAEETEWHLGLKSGYKATKNEETGLYEYTAAEVEDGTYTSWGDYQNQRIQGIIGGYLGLGFDMFGEGTRATNPRVWKNKVDENYLPYLVDGYPDIRFFDADTNQRITELATDINAYVNETYVKFISGDLEMTDENLATYFQTIKDLGYDEYLKYFTDYYDAYKAALK